MLPDYWGAQQSDISIVSYQFSSIIDALFSSFPFGEAYAVMIAAAAWAIFHAMNTQRSREKIGDELGNVGVSGHCTPISISLMDPVIT